MSVYTVVQDSSSGSRPSAADFRAQLEKGKDEDKILAMNQILVTMLNGDLMPELLMHVIRYVMPSKNKELKKLLYFYWEVVPKVDDEGKLKQEMILVCNAIQHDLAHANEYIRGNTLRFLCKLKEHDLLEPLVPHARACLEHRHLYVRKNAVFAIYLIYKVSDHLLPDAPELIAEFLAQETDPTCRRNAFVCLGDVDRERTLRFLQDNLSNLINLDTLLQLAIIEFLRRDVVVAPGLKPQYLQIIYELLELDEPAVMFDASNVLTVLLLLTSAVVAAAQNYIELATKESNNNVRLILLEKFDALREANAGVLDDCALDVLRVLLLLDVGLRLKVLEIALKLASLRNIDDIVKVLKKELQLTVTLDDESAGDYRQAIIEAIHQSAIRFGQVAASVVDLLLELLGDLSTPAASEVITLVKEVVEKFPDLRLPVVHKLIVALQGVKSGKVYRGLLWILGEYCLEEKDIQDAWRHIRGAVGEIPIISSEQRAKAGENNEDAAVERHGASGPVVLPDGTYATESALTAEVAAVRLTKPALRELILQGDFYTAAVLLSTLVKLVLRFRRISENTHLLNALKAEAMLMMVLILRAGELLLVKKKADEDSAERILGCVRFLTDEEHNEFLEPAFLEDTREAFRKQVEEAESRKAAAAAKALREHALQVDDTLQFRQLAGDKVVPPAVVSDSASAPDLLSRLNLIVQLTGFSDNVYAEAYVKVHQFDVVLDVLIVNQTTATLRNLAVEFAVIGDLKVIDRPSPTNVGPHGFHRVQVTVKVTSADTGIIFGNIIYDGQHADEALTIILNDIHIDAMEYFKPALCSELLFRSMWNEFEWENKLTVKVNKLLLREYLETVQAVTNMACLTPGAVVGEECMFLLANLYARLLFGEDVLANLLIEKKADGPVVGDVRIRSKGQGLALSIGEKISAIK